MGGLLMEDFFKKKVVVPRRNNHIWPEKHHTSLGDWQTWRRWLKSICRHHSMMLLNSLEVWECPLDTWIHQWDCFLTSNMEILYIYRTQNRDWTRHIIQPGRRRRNNRYFVDALICNGPVEPPEDLLRATVQHHREYIEVTSAASLFGQRRTDPHMYPVGWDPFLVHNDILLRKLTEALQPVYLESTPSLELLFADFSKGTLVSVSDGSYFPESNQAACAWLIESSCRSQWIMGSMKIPGSSQDFSAYRSELGGLLALSVTIKLLSCCLPGPKHLIVGCDGKAALNTLTATHEDISASSGHSDLQSIIIDLWASMETSPYPVHILGHQDENNNPLTRLETMNVLVDRLATLTARLEYNPTVRLKLPNMGMDTVQYKGCTIGGALYGSLYNGLIHDRMMAYYSTKLFSSSIVTHTVHYRSFSTARNLTYGGMNKFITKWISNTIATGRILQRRKHRIFNRCPRCDAWGEDKLYVVVCWDIRAKIIWDKQMEQLKRLMASLHTNPDIYTFITTGLAQFRTHPTTRLIHHFTPDDEWKTEQLDIGWLNFLTGFISSKMIQKQQDHYVTLGRRNRGHIWAAKIINHGWNIT